MLVTKELYHQYSKAQSFAFPDINCNPNQTLLVLGKSGVGKTTLLHILAGILKPSKGEVSLDGTSLYGKSSNKLDSFRGQNIGLVFQKPHFVQSISARENLMLGQKMAGNSLNPQLIDKLLDQLNITKLANSKTQTMSQGEQQRLSIARALVNQPKVILADEPTSALDDENCNEVIKLLSTQAEQHQAALIIVTHDNRLKDYFSDQIELS